MPDASIEHALSLFLIEELGLAREDFDVDTELFSSGLLDSFALAMMVAFADAEFGVSLRAAAVTKEQVDSVAAFGRTVRRHLESSATRSGDAADG